MARILFTMGDVQRAYFGSNDQYAYFESNAQRFARQAAESRTREAAAAAAAATAAATPKSASQLAKEAGQAAQTFTRRTKRGGLAVVKKGMRKVSRNKMVRAIDQGAGRLMAQTGQAAKDVAGHVGKNAGRYALGAAALGAAAGGAAYLMNRDRQNYSRQVRTVYFSRRSY